MKMKKDMNTIFVFDSNVWIDLFLLDVITTQYIAEKLKQHKEFFFIPFQVCEEVRSNHKRVMEEARNKVQSKIENFTSIVDKTISDIEREFGIAKQIDRFVEPEYEKVIADIKGCKEKSIKKLEILNIRHIKTYTPYTENPILQLITDIQKLNGQPERIPDSYLFSIFLDQSFRKQYKLPPGDLDQRKKQKQDEDQNDYKKRKLGDLLIWKEIIQFAKRNNCSICFVENETKEDWWTRSKADKLQPNKFLLDEFKYETNQTIELMNFQDFLVKYSKKFEIKNSKIKDLTIFLRLKSGYEKIQNAISKEFNKFLDDFDDSEITSFLLDRLDLYDDVDGVLIESYDLLEINYCINESNPFEGRVEGIYRLTTSCTTYEYLMKDLYETRDSDVEINIKLSKAFIINSKATDFDNDNYTTDPIKHEFEDEIEIDQSYDSGIYIDDSEE